MPEFKTVHYFLWRGGLRIIEMHTTSANWLDRYLGPLVSPLFYLLALVHGRRQLHDSPEDAVARMDCARKLNSLQSLRSLQSCIVAEKCAVGDSANCQDNGRGL
jgi:hypothetical protein